MEYIVISFYRYYKVKDTRELKDYIKGLCNGLEILGRILIADEGINGSLCGKKENISIFKEKIKQIRKLKDLSFRDQLANEQVYHKLVIRTRKEIVYFDKKVDLKKKGNYIYPRELKRLLDNKEDIVLLDARNDYEYKIGKFKDSIALPIQSFREFPGHIGKLEKFKDKKIVMYCTGGVRCEKASAFLKENGFKDVNQIYGGIINFINTYPNSYFEGSCFVFDDRIVSKVGNKTLSNCELCGIKSDSYINCHNLDCDKLLISCKSCQDKMNFTCSLDCKNSKRQRILVKT